MKGRVPVSHILHCAERIFYPSTLIARIVCLSVEIFNQHQIAADLIHLAVQN